MGNQNKTQRNVKIIRREEDDHYVINLDEIVEQWVRQIWNKTKTKSSSRLKHEDLLISINWKRVSFVQNKVYFYNSSSSSFSRRLFWTHFDNRTMNDQSYTLATERSTCSLFKFLYTHSLSKSQESTITFHLPEQIIKLNGSIPRELHTQFSQDTTKEYEIAWNVNSQIRVPSGTRINAELNIDEQEFHSNFSVSIRFAGHITATISTRQSPNIPLKCIDGDIVRIICEAKKNNHRLDALEILEGNLPSICFTIRGNCSFRYGIKQNIVLNQERLSSSDFVCVPSAPSEYGHLKLSDYD